MDHPIAVLAISMDPYRNQLLWIAGLIAQEYAAYLDGKEDKTGGK